ncbi:MAG TPA: hypothetical protein VE262_21995 [Blastocatellia bacterium]|nr:hypothetical protein [Blastocatellia bacterium]
MKKLFAASLLVLVSVSLAHAQGALQISLKSGSEKENQKKAQIERLLKQYDLSKWLFTKSVLIDEQTGIPHSHPVLTLNADELDDDPRTLATFIHEQIHWFGDANRAGVEKAIEELKMMYPQAPGGPPEGARNSYSTYLHLIVCYLEYQGMKELVGNEKAKQVIEASSKRFYKWIYRTVLSDEAKLRAVVEKHGLKI